MSISKADYKVLILLDESKASNELKALTLDELKELAGLSIAKLRKTVRTFKDVGYVREGAVDKKAKTYFITEDGSKKLKLLN